MAELLANTNIHTAYIRRCSTHNNYKHTSRAVKHNNTDNSATCLVIGVVVLAWRHRVMLNTQHLYKIYVGLLNTQQL